MHKIVYDAEANCLDSRKEKKDTLIYDSDEKVDEKEIFEAKREFSA